MCSQEFPCTHYSASPDASILYNHNTRSKTKELTLVLDY